MRISNNKTKILTLVQPSRLKQGKIFEYRHLECILPNNKLAHHRKLEKKSNFHSYFRLNLFLFYKCKMSIFNKTLQVHICYRNLSANGFNIHVETSISPYKINSKHFVFD